MTLRLRAHREVLEEYLQAVGQHNSYIIHQSPDVRGVAGAVKYEDDEEDSLPTVVAGHSNVVPQGSSAPSINATSVPPPFETIQSANTLAMLLRVFVEKQQRDDRNKRPAEHAAPIAEADPNGSPPRSCSDYPFGQRSSLAQPLTPRPTATNASQASPSPIAGSEYSPLRAGPIDCWVDEGEIMMATEALRRFKAATGVGAGDGVGSSALGRRHLLAPEIALKRQSRREDFQEEVMEEDEPLSQPISGGLLVVKLTRPTHVTVVRQKKSLLDVKPVDLPSTFSDGPAASVGAPSPGTSAGPSKDLSHNKLKQPFASPANFSAQQPTSNDSIARGPANGSVATAKSTEQDALITDIHRMVREMRETATAMKETLAAETGVMDDAAQRLLDATDKTKTQIKNVEAIGGLSASSNGGIIERLLRKVLPSSIVAMLMQSLAAIIALIKTILLVFTILAITAGTLFIIFARKKPQSTVIYE